MITFCEILKKILTVILLLVVSTLLSNKSCYAYFSIEPVEPSIKTITSDTSTLPSSASYYLVWSDNHNFYRHLSTSIVELQQTSKRNLFAFYIPILETVTKQREHYIPSEFNFENLLYANLKINRLINEYNSLKARSNLVLEGLDVPYIIWTPSFESKLNNKNYTILNKIDQINEHQRIFTSPVFFDFNNVYIANHSKNQPSEPSLSEKTFYNKQAPINSSSYSEGSRSEFTRKQGRNTYNSGPNASAKEKDYQSYDSTNEQLPWLLRGLLSLFDYAIKNKTKMIIYIVLIFGVYYVLFGMRK